MRRLAILTLTLLLAGPAPAQEAVPEKDAQVAALVEKLGNNEWAVRERAQRDLTALGEVARPRLQDALTSDDLEVRSRASAALIAIGESFAHAVACAADTHEGRRRHGRAALSALFRVDDPGNLRTLSAQDLQERWWGGDRATEVIAPPALAIARFEAASGLHLLIAPDARKAWGQVMQAGKMSLYVPSDPDQVAQSIQYLQQALAQALGNSPQDQLRVNAMRVGRARFLFVRAEGVATGEDLARMCGEQLIEDLLADGPNMARAARLLAEGAAGDATSAKRIRDEYAGNPASTRLMWLALALGRDDTVAAAARRQDAALAVSLLSSHDWAALGMAAAFLACLEPAPRGEVLSPVIAGSKDALQVLAALWCAAGCPLSTEARTRVADLLSSKEDALAAACARWLATCPEITDAELDRTWDAAQPRSTDNEFFRATLALVARPEVAERLLPRARKALAAVFPAQQALAAAVLTGRADEADLLVVLDKLAGASRTPELALRLSGLFSGCSKLSDAALEKLAAGLQHTDPEARRLFRRAALLCEAELRRLVCTRALDALEKTLASAPRAPRHLAPARIGLWGLLGGLGDGEALDKIMKAAQSDEGEIALAAGAALVDAVAGEPLFKTLEALKTRKDAPNGPAVAMEGYLELCRRAAAAGDRALFRRANALATAADPNMGRQFNVLRELRAQLNHNAAAAEEQELLPRNLALAELELK
ncbi:MAG: hypothetical protein IT463_12200 [Planctomycetes bacterium]|nr:hypothetical protein [Planctomycetota bacterium]